MPATPTCCARPSTDPSASDVRRVRGTDRRGRPGVGAAAHRVAVPAPTEALPLSPPPDSEADSAGTSSRGGEAPARGLTVAAERLAENAPRAGPRGLVPDRPRPLHRGAGLEPAEQRARP